MPKETQYIPFYSYIKIYSYLLTIYLCGLEQTLFKQYYHDIHPTINQFIMAHPLFNIQIKFLLKLCPACQSSFNQKYVKMQKLDTLSGIELDTTI